MKNVFALTLLFAFLALGYAATVTTGIIQPGKCVVRDEVYEPGVHTDHDSCARINCNESGSAEITTCPRQPVKEGCELGNRLKPEADYPDCCEVEITCS